MSIGRTVGHAPHLPDQPTANPTEEEKQLAKQRIEGSLAPSSHANPLKPSDPRNM